MPHHPDDPNLAAFKALMSEVFGPAPAPSRFAKLRSWLAQLEAQLSVMQVTISDIRAELDRLDAISRDLP